jgi:hypothetical protein
MRPCINLEDAYIKAYSQDEYTELMQTQHYYIVQFLWVLNESQTANTFYQTLDLHHSYTEHIS